MSGKLKLLDFYLNHWDQEHPTCPLCGGTVAETTKDLSNEILFSNWHYRDRKIWECPTCNIYFRIEVEKRYSLNFTPQRVKEKYGKLKKNEARYLIVSAVLNEYCKKECVGSIGHTPCCDSCIANPNILGDIIEKYLI